jgi:peptidoglycan/LPS O-acetylase OafA/YrhL
MTQPVDTNPLAGRPSATGKSRINALDGLRAVALLIIMGYHFGVGWLQGGFFSLDIFYVLSGYLITGLLLSEFAKRGRIKLSAFWLRRARRLLPALLIVLVAVTLMVRFAEPAGLYPGFRQSALSALFYYSNWWQIHTSSNYFVATGAVSPLTHTWSLAVEEQFYLVWPLVVLAVLFLARSFGKGLKALFVVSTVGALASALEMAFFYSPTANLTRLYFGTDTHAQSILVGASMACALTMIQRRRGEEGMAPKATSKNASSALIALGLLGFAGTFTLTYLQTGTTRFDYQGGFFLSALSAAAIIVGAVCVPKGPIARTLSLKPLVWLGTISYGAYLWHYPIFIYFDATRTGTTGFPLLVIRFAATLALATASFYLVERPVMYGTFWRQLKAAIPAVALIGATVAVVVAGTVVPATAAVPMASNPAPGPDGGGAHRVHVFMIGDSLSLTVSLGILPFASDYGIDLIGGPHTGCGLAVALPLDTHGIVGDPFPNCPMWPTWWRDDVQRFHPQVFGLIIGWWETVDRKYQGRWQHLGDPAFDAYETAQFEKAIAILSSDGAKVALFTAPYFDSGEQPNGQPWDQDAPQRVDRLNGIIEAVAHKYPTVVHVIPLNHYLDPNGHFTWTINGQVVRQPDGIHTTPAGGRYLAPKILPQLAAMGRSD